MTPTRAMATQTARKPIVDEQLEAELAALPATDHSAATDAQRFALYVQATERASARRDLMPDLPEAIFKAVNRTTDARGTRSEAHRTLEIPAEVAAAHNRRIITGLDAAGASLTKIELTGMLGHFSIGLSR